MSEAPTATDADDRKVQVTLSISASLLERIDAAALSEVRSRSNYIEATLTSILAPSEG